jgi:hypothetical protein
MKIFVGSLCRSTNKVTCVAALLSRFFVLPQAFVVHLSHPKSELKKVTVQYGNDVLPISLNQHADLHSPPSRVLAYRSTIQIISYWIDSRHTSTINLIVASEEPCATRSDVQPFHCVSNLGEPRTETHTYFSSPNLKSHRSCLVSCAYPKFIPARFQEYLQKANDAESLKLHNIFKTEVSICARRFMDD